MLTLEAKATDGKAVAKAKTGSLEAEAEATHPSRPR